MTAVTSYINDLEKQVVELREALKKIARLSYDDIADAQGIALEALSDGDTLRS